MADIPDTRDGDRSEDHPLDFSLGMHPFAGGAAILLMHECFSANGSGFLHAGATAVAVVFLCTLAECLPLSREGARCAFLLTLTSLPVALVLGFVTHNSKLVFG